MDERKTTLTDGTPVTPDHREIDPATGMQKGYVVLSAEERAKGWVRPLRRTYTHVGRINEQRLGGPRLGGCGTDTTMGLALAETWASDIYFYGGTYCCFCRAHFPLNEFVWAGTEEMVGS